MAEALSGTVMRPPIVPLVANVTADASCDADEIRDLLVRQVTATVRWRESVLRMRDNGVDRVIELGGGRVLSSLVRRIDRDMTGVNVDGPDDVEALLKEL